MTTPPTRFTVGVELEFIILALSTDDPDPHEAQKEQLPPVLRIPAETVDDEYDTGWQNSFFAQEKVKDLLMANGFPVDNPPLGTRPRSLTSRRIREYESYEVKLDSSIEECDTRGYRITRMEIPTPVQFESPDAYRAISYMIDLLCSSYRIIVNPSCGLHVHVGNSKAEHMSLAHIKRLSSLLWAADPLLAMLHSPRRQQSVMCKSIRYLTRLSRGDSVTCDHDDPEGFPGMIFDCNRYIGTDVRFGEESPLWHEEHKDPETIDAFGETRKPGCYAPFFEDSTDNGGTRNDLADNIPSSVATKTTDAKNPSRAYSPPRRRKHRRFRLRNLTEEQMQKYREENEKYSIITKRLEDPEPQDPGVFEGVKRIFDSSSSCQIQKSLDPGLRANYNFANYCCTDMCFNNAEMRRTVEWREADGTFNAQWVVTWARIAVSLTRFAVYSPVFQFLEVLALCNEAMNEDGKYDVIDLLDALGLFAEAEFVEERLAKLAEEYSLEYVD